MGNNKKQKSFEETLWDSAGDLIESNLILNCKHSYHADQTGRIGNSV